MLRLLLRVSRRSSRYFPLRAPVWVSAASTSRSLALSLLRDNFLRGVRLSDLDVERDLDRDLELDSRLYDRRDRGGGEALTDLEIDLLRLAGRGERDIEESVGEGDLLRVPRSGLLPLPLPPRPLNPLLRPGDLVLRRRGLGERDLDDDLSRRRGGGDRETDGDLADTGDLESGVGDLLRSSLRRPAPRPLGT